MNNSGNDPSANYKVPGYKIDKIVDDLTTNKVERPSLFEKFAILNLENLEEILLLSKPERILLCFMLSNLRWRNMVIMTLDHVNIWLKRIGRSPIAANHISSAISGLEKQNLIKEVEKISSRQKGMQDIVTFCLNPYYFFKGPGLKGHKTLIDEWNNDCITPPNRKRKL